MTRGLHGGSASQTKADDFCLPNIIIYGWITSGPHYTSNYLLNKNWLLSTFCHQMSYPASLGEIPSLLKHGCLRPARKNICFRYSASLSRAQHQSDPGPGDQLVVMCGRDLNKSYINHVFQDEITHGCLFHPLKTFSSNWDHCTVIIIFVSVRCFAHMQYTLNKKGSMKNPNWFYPLSTI